jgi:signal transduction histidine kinase
VKYAASGGWMGLTVKASTWRGRPVVEIAVRDRGPGIPSSDLAHVFEPFYRGRTAMEQQIHGSGLGLSLVKRIAEAHGGGVEVSSVPGEGTCFSLFLPVAILAKTLHGRRPSASTGRSPAEAPRG